MPHLTNYFPPSGGEDVSGGFEEIEGEPYLAIRNVDGMPYFLMSIVSAGDLWMFAGSNASMTAGRVSPERAIFPYRTADKILSQRGGGNLFCSILVEGESGMRELWEPWSEFRGSPVCRNLYKHVTGGTLIFEEIHEASGLAFRWHIGFSDAHGVVKRASLANRSSSPAGIRCLEGFQHILPPGVPLEMQDRKSYLALAYMRHEQAGRLSIYSVNSGITDRAEPCESLRYAAAWTAGGEGSASLLSDRQISAFRAGRPVASEQEARGVSGSHLQVRELRLAAGETAEWWSAADTWLDHADLVMVRQKLSDPGLLLESLKQGCLDNLSALRLRIGEVDGWQLAGDPAVRPHHAANSLFNAMRGGLPASGAGVPAGDFAKFVGQRNREAAAGHASWLKSLPADLDVADLRRLADGQEDPNIRRLAHEYLPLTFGRRHGDPSRPWNTFAIHVQEKSGQPILNYQGNWRDVFQNWEAMALSHPLHLPAMVEVFLNASTADGYNPYRIERAGVGWEVFDPADPWSNIGYWGDHQIIYLSRLLELHERFFPGVLAARFETADYVYTDVPYRIRPWDELASNPGGAIRFDLQRHDELLARAASLGNDGKLLCGAGGEVVRATLAEKLLVPALAKLASLVPGGGIWMNTQRPEWNDANNALAGWGLSVVTVCHLHRHLLLLREMFQAAGSCALPASLAEFLSALRALFQEDGARQAVEDSHERWKFMARAGHAADAYRAAAYAGLSGGRTSVSPCELLGFLASAAEVCRATILASRRTDGLFHSYNFLKIHGGHAEIQRLDVMLEGQVAVLCARCLSAREALDIVCALQRSALYRQDQNSYILYPDRRMVPILERNRITGAERAPVLAAMAGAGVQAIAARDSSGDWRFQPDLTNAKDLSSRLAALEKDGLWGAEIRRDRHAILAMWEEAFQHAAFTGRSAGMFGFEGLGSIYWHMVAKLLLAVGECLAEACGDDPEARDGLALAYHEIRSGLGFCKTPFSYGAFPSDPYSHTPAHAGAQQPGMTGQVKEEILCRLIELGVNVRGGRISFEPDLLRAEDFLASPAAYSFAGKSGRWERLDLPADALAFTICQTPVIYVLGGGEPSIRVEYADGRAPYLSAGMSLLAEDTGDIIRRSPAIMLVAVSLSRERLRSPITSRCLRPETL
ncbi:MAG: hypothetical protein WCS65_03335 [Verrucomicrobiae bacterium]